MGLLRTATWTLTGFAAAPLLDFALGTAVVVDDVELHPKLTPDWLREAGGEVAGIRAAAA